MAPNRRAMAIGKRKALSAIFRMGLLLRLGLTSVLPLASGSVFGPRHGWGWRGWRSWLAPVLSIGDETIDHGRVGQCRCIAEI